MFYLQIHIYYLDLKLLIFFIQQEFKEWHERRKIDYFFLADELNPDALDEIILASEEGS